MTEYCSCTDFSQTVNCSNADMIVSCNSVNTNNIYTQSCIFTVLFTLSHTVRAVREILLPDWRATETGINEKNAQRRRKHCALAVVRRSQKFCPAADPFPGGAGRPKFKQLEIVTTFTYKPSLVRIDARNFTHKFISPNW